MTGIADQFSRYRDALAGKRIEWERGDPASGFYKRNASDGRIEAVAIFRDDVGELQCIRNVYGNGSNLDADKIEELFASCSFYPIPESVFRDVTEHGKPWPAGYETRLTNKEIQAGIVWSPELGRKKLGLAENERAVIGGNEPPEPTPEDESGHVLVGEQTPDKLAFAAISKLMHEIKNKLESWGGKPRNKDDADTLADFATKLSDLGKKADKDRDAEKRPHLEAGRDVDARWKTSIANAENGKKRCKAIIQEWRDAENARLAEQERKANEAAAAEAAKAGKEAPAPIQVERVSGVGNIRTVAERETTSWVVVDARAFLAHLITKEGELPHEIVEAAGKVASRRAMAAPGVEARTERRAA